MTLHLFNNFILIQCFHISLLLCYGYLTIEHRTTAENLVIVKIMQLA